MILELIRERMAEGGLVPVCDLLGMKLENVEPGRARVSIEAGPRLWNPFGTVHGGILCDLSDLAMGLAFMTTLGEGEGLATIELKINYFRPVSEGAVFAEAKVVHRGRSTGFVECDVTDLAGKLLARAGSTCMVVTDGRAAKLGMKGTGNGNS